MILRSFALAAACAFGAVAPAHAAAVVLWPVDPTIAAGQTATALWIENKGKDPVTVQIRSFAWTQDGREDRYADQDEVVVSPPITTIASGVRQLVRIIRRSPDDARAEQSYRLLIDELPPTIQEGDTGTPTAQLSVQMRYSLPLFTYGRAAAPQVGELKARIEQADGKRFIVVTNPGATHARLVDLRTVAAGRRINVLPGLVGYVLAGQTMRWALPANVAVAGDLEVNVNGTDRSLAPNA